MTLNSFLLFNANKSAWLYVTKGKQHYASTPEFFIDGKRINLVSYEILSKRNSLCAKINNVLCYFSKRDQLVKLKLLRSYYIDFYGSVLWDSALSSVEDVCITWRNCYQLQTEVEVFKLFIGLNLMFSL